MKNNLIIVPSGDYSLHHNWISGNTNFDLVIIYYGDSEEKFNEYSNQSVHCVRKKGQKWHLISEYITNNFNNISNYEYFWFPDDDLLTNTEDINLYFDTIKENSLWLSQPSLSGYVSYEIENKVVGSKLRFTNFVEIICPSMDKKTVFKLINYFTMNESGWGMDYLWPKILGYPVDKIAIVDIITVEHTKPVGVNYNGRFTKEPMQELQELFYKYNLTFNQQIYSSIQI